MNRIANLIRIKLAERRNYKMTQISKYPISAAVEKRIFEIFFGSIVHLNNTTDVSQFLDDFLTPTEKMMLAKRLAVAVLLTKGYEYREIRKTLRVSFPMIANVNIWLKYKGKGYQKVIEKILREEKIEEFWQKIDDVITNVVPPGHTNWSYWRSKKWQEKMEKAKPF